MGPESSPWRPCPKTCHPKKQSPWQKLAVAGLVVLGCGAAAAGWGFAWDQAMPTQSALVVLVTVGEREAGAAEVLRLDEAFCLRAEDFAAFTWIEVAPTASGLAVTTPLGETLIPEGEIRRVEGEPYLCEAILLQRLAVHVTFDPATVTLRLDVPWSLAARVLPAAAFVPEIRAPGWGLGTLHLDVNGVVEEGSFSYAGNAWATGRAFGGEWRLLAETAAQGEAKLRELIWVSRKPRWYTFVGRDYVQLAPILSGFDVVGAGFGWSNRRLPALGPWGFLTGFAATATRSFRGTAPAGSFVKLRINGAVVASQQVGLTGRYEFLDVPVSGGRSSVSVEVEIYDRHNLLTPVAVHRFFTPTSWLLLPYGAVEVVGGAGFGGLWGRDFLGGDATLRKEVAYAALRWGMGESLTAQGMVQAVGGHWQTGAGVAWQVSPSAFTALTVAQAKGATAWNWEGAVQKNVWSLLASAWEQPGSFRVPAGTGGRRDYAVELRYNPFRWLEVGLWGRKRDFPEEHAQWIRPTAVLALGNWLFLRAAPDQWGDSTVFATSQPHPRLRLSASYFHSQLYDVLWELPTARLLDLRGTYECGGMGKSRLTLSLGNRVGSFRAPRLRVGIMTSAGHLAPYGEVSAPVVSGLWFRAQYLGIPSRLQGGEKPAGRLFFSLAADFGYSMGTLVATDQWSLRRELGGVAGRLLVSGKASAINLSGARVQVVGFGGSSTGPDGRFFIGNVPPGVYEVELDPERLPLELVPVQRRFVVEVAAGVITRVDFPLRQLFGLAGQVRTRDGTGIPGIRVALLQKERIVAFQEADAFGYFRFDQLEPGVYELAALRGEQKLVQRTVVLEEFLFAQDLEVDAGVMPATPTETAPEF